MTTLSKDEKRTRQNYAPIIQKAIKCIVDFIEMTSEDFNTVYGLFINQLILQKSL